MDREAIRKLKEQRASVWEQAKSLLDEVNARTGDDAGWHGEEDATWARLDAEVDELTKSIDRNEKLLELNVRDAAVIEEREEKTGTPVEQYNAVFDTYVRQGMGGLEPDERRILAGHATDPELRAQGVGTGAAGGFTVPEGFWNRIVETKLAFGGVSQVASNITTATGQDLPWMTNDDTGNVGAILSENTQITEQDIVMGTDSLGAYLYTSKLIRVSYQLLQDSAVDVEGLLARKMGERLARIHNTHQTTGTGTAQPQGIVVGATTGKTTASGTAITYNEIIDLIHSVDPAYRGPQAQFMFNDGILGYLRKIVDDSGGAGLGRPLWEPSVQVGAPNTIHGHAYTINQDMQATVATATTTILFGDFAAGYIIRDVKGVNVVRLDERYADYLQVGWFAYDRQDSLVDDANAYKAMVQA
jgi:HK97 family phage major capsid protein